jgi:hypothetical protein
VGTGASFSAGYAMLLIMFVASLQFIYRKVVTGAREWYEEAILEEHGIGHLEI